MYASVVPAASRRVSGVSSVAFRLAGPPSGPHELTLRLAAPGPVSGEGLDPLCRHSSDVAVAAGAVLPPPEESGGASEDGPSASFAPGILGAPFTARLQSTHVFLAVLLGRRFAQSKEGNSMKQLFLTGLVVEIGLASACPREGLRTVRPQEAPLDRRREARPRASSTRHRAARSTGSPTNARAEPRHAQLRRGPR